jgi:hypothetical protein
MSNNRDRHLSEEELLRYADGEIPEEQSWISRHLLSCWDCRARLSDLETAIKAIVQFRNNDFLPAIPNPPRPWANLGDHLRALEVQRRASWSRIFSVIFSSFHRHRAASAAGFVLVCALVALWLVHPPPVSASAVLAKALAAESRASLSSTGKVVHQRFRLRKTAKSDRHETLLEFGIWRGTNMFRITASSTGAAALKDLEGVYETNGLNWRDPLSATAYAGWRANLREAHDTVAQTDPGETTVRTFAKLPGLSIASIASAEITLRKPDYHVIHERLSTADDDYDITETHFDAVPAEAFPLMSRKITPGRATAGAETRGDEPPKPGVTLTDDQIEMAIRHALHHLGADLGDPITVGRGPEGEVILEVLDVKPNRLAEIEDLLHRYPSVIIDRTGTLLRDSQPCASCDTTPLLPLPDGSAGDFDSDFEKHFGGSNELQAFIHQVLGLSDKTMAHAYALKVLASRYDEVALKSLTEDSKGELWEMVVNHATAMADTAAELETEVRPVLRETAPAQDSRANARSESGWQSGAMEAFRRVQTVDRMLKSAFTRTNSPIGPTEALRQLPEELSTETTILARYLALVEKEANRK